MRDFILELLLIIVFLAIPMSSGSRLTLNFLGTFALHSTEEKTQVVLEPTEQPIPTYSLSPEDYIDSHSKTIKLKRELLDIEFEEMFRLYMNHTLRENVRLFSE